jgi:hypothetical protein
MPTGLASRCAVLALASWVILASCGARALEQENPRPTSQPTPVVKLDPSIPNIALYATPCPNFFHFLVFQGIMKGLGAMLSKTVDVEPAGTTEECSGNVQRVGLWLSAPANQADAGKRTQWLANAPMLPLSGTDEFELVLQNNDIFAMAQSKWDAYPKTLNSSFFPDPSGPVQLQSFTINADSADQAYVAVVKGHENISFPGADFTFIEKDTLGIKNGRLTSTASTSINTDDSGILLAAVISGLSSTVSSAFTLEDAVVSSQSPPGAITSVGQNVAAMLPESIMIPGGLKVDLTFSSVSLGQNLLALKGTYSFDPRHPSMRLTIYSPTVPGAGKPGLPASETVTTVDLRAPIKYKWTTKFESHTLVQSTTEPINHAALPLSPSDVKKPFTVSLSATDADGLSASDNKAGKIGGPLVINQACLKKPWLPNCSPTH